MGGNPVFEWHYITIFTKLKDKAESISNQSNLDSNPTMECI